LATAAAAGASPAQRRTVTELEAGASGILATRDFWGVELGLARRPPGQGRIAVTAAAGAASGAAALRVVATGQFMLAPAAQSGASPYAGLGLAFAGARGRHGAGYLTGVLGLESAPGRSRGWYAELGLGGGLTAACGIRWRRFPGGP
jgi:hypothetical protein